MTEIYIVNYCHPALEPLKSITRLTEAESYRVAHKLAGAHEGASFRRFGPDYKGYYPHRMRAEKWLYQQFTALGGEPETEHPCYFVLKESALLKDWFDGGVISRLPLSLIDEKHISFTYGDSQSMLDKPNRRPVFLKRDLLNLIAARGGADALIHEIYDEYRYIEAQLWSDAYMSLAERVE